MPTDLIAEIKTARQLLREEENRTHEAAIELRNCKDRERKARNELDALLDALESGQDGRYPLFPEAAPTGNGQAAPARTEPPLAGRRRGKGVVP